MQILIDTSVVIDFLRQKNKDSTLLYRLVQEDNGLSISIISHTELYSGKSVWENKVAQKDLEKILSGLKISALNKDISIKAGEIKTKYNVDLIDAIIAATGVVEKLPLSTLNMKHFQNISGLKLL